MSKSHWMIRAGDGINFMKSNYAVWGVKRGRGGSIKTLVQKFKEGDILWFFTSKKFGGKFIGMTEYTYMYDRKDEPLIKINTLTNADQNWVGGEDWSIQIHYKNLYITFFQNIKVCIQHSSIIFEYEKYREQVEGNLIEHYNGYKFYGQCVERPCWV